MPFLREGAIHIILRRVNGYYHVQKSPVRCQKGLKTFWSHTGLRFEVEIIENNRKKNIENLALLEPIYNLIEPKILSTPSLTGVPKNTWSASPVFFNHEHGANTFELLIQP